LLIIDSDRNLVEMLTSWLKTFGYQVDRAYIAEQARAKWREQQPDFVIVESALKGVDALAMCRELQSKHDALVLVVTEGKDIADEVRCLEAGADDYLRKPFLPDQLLARIHAVSRRARSTVKVPPSSRITVGPLCVDPLHNEVSIHGKTIRLTPIEGKLVNLLATNADNVCTASQIVAHVWGFSGGDSSLIKTHIYHLRQKIERDPDHPRYIQTVPGIGYILSRRFDEEPQVAREERFHPVLVATG
ncbi:MAG: response regulator transcription factor, partial [Ktedonobacteraceae bacterium]